jgi:hypothetical protein
VTEQPSALTLPGDSSPAVDLLLAVRGGDVGEVERLVTGTPGLATARISARGGTRTALHLVTDWPGYFPNGPRVVHLLVDAGADPNALTTPGPAETPLHWAASTDDVDVAAALVDRGADLETPGGSIGTPLDNAVGYACWHVARLLAERGARVERLWHAAALGAMDRIEEVLARGDATPDQVSQGFWHACAAGQRRAAQRLLDAGARLDWTPDYAIGTVLDAALGRGTGQDNVIEWLRALGATSSDER